MSRSEIPFAVGDISALARALGAHFSEAGVKLGHVELLNVLARSAGFRNFQHYRAVHVSHGRLAAAEPLSPSVDYKRIERVARHFDPFGCLVRWPKKASYRELCLWVFWFRLTPRKVFTEVQINEALRANHSFGDHVLLRRGLVDLGLLWRTTDGRQYRRVERPPTAEAIALIRHLEHRLHP